MASLGTAQRRPCPIDDEEVTSSLPAILLDRSEQTPRAEFLIVWDPLEGVRARLTYSEMAQRMLSAARWLRDEVGLRARAQLPLLAENSAAYIALSLGAMCLTSTSVNLNWKQPPHMSAALLTTLGASVLVASRHFARDAVAIRDAIECGERHKPSGFRVFVRERADTFDVPPSPTDAAALAACAKAVAADATAAVFFTGGTTGQPKAVPHTHDALVWMCRKLHRQCAAPFEGGDSGALALMPYFHVMGFVANTVRALGYARAVSMSHSLPPPATAAQRPPSLAPARTRMCTAVQLGGRLPRLRAGLSDGDDRRRQSHRRRVLLAPPLVPQPGAVCDGGRVRAPRARRQAGAQSRAHGRVQP